MKHFTIRVSGKVQGVFFRASTKEEADRLGVTGFVKNEPDGSVLIEAEGPSEIIEEFIAWCHHGPRSARVAACQVTEGPVKNIAGFNIVR